MPVLCATLDLPVIIDGAIDSGYFPAALFGSHLDRTGYPFAARRSSGDSDGGENRT